MRDRLGRVIQDVYTQQPAQDGENVRLTIDSQIQYLSYQALEKAVEHHAADSGGAVVIDTQTGEILSMVSYPSYDPNDRSARKGGLLRNRAVTDVFEPGSIIKPFVAALAL
ncbi:penicillin-binding protein 2 [Oligella ureolytica]